VAVLSFRPNVWYPGPVALLDELYVRPSLRNRRIGRALLEAACATARRRGAELLEINVDGDDTDARRFYESHGFTHTEPGARQPSFYYSREL
jgi:GNAT superfamily N-acetyltransferase